MSDLVFPTKWASPNIPVKIIEDIIEALDERTPLPRRAAIAAFWSRFLRAAGMLSDNDLVNPEDAADPEKLREKLLKIANVAGAILGHKTM